MALHQNRQFQKVGLPEFLLLVLLGGAALCVTLWWQERAEPRYAEAEGRVVEANLSWVHYNATDTRQKVSLTYEYALGPKTYRHSWTGFWPEFGSPNALPGDQLEPLCTQGRPLVVLYDPANPDESHLHPPEETGTVLYGGMALSSCAIAMAYCALFYPAWRFRH